MYTFFVHIVYDNKYDSKYDSKYGLYVSKYMTANMIENNKFISIYTLFVVAGSTTN